MTASVSTVSLTEMASVLISMSVTKSWVHAEMVNVEIPWDHMCVTVTKVMNLLMMEKNVLTRTNAPTSFNADKTTLFQDV